MAIVLSAMANRQMRVSELAVELPRYEIYKTKVTMASDKVATSLDQLETHFSAAEGSRMDGLRLDWSKKWLLIRASNTEPIVRLIAEAETMDDAKQLCDEAREILGKA